MNPTTFYEQVSAAMAAPPQERHRHLRHLHAQALRSYQTVLHCVTAEQVILPLSNHSDQRTIAQIIGHIAAWDRFAVLAAGDILAGIQHPRMITDLSGYRDADGTFLTFATIDEFNAYHAHTYQTWSWNALQHFADAMATTLYSLFEHPHLLSASRLEQTKPHWKRLHNRALIDNIPMGWNLWLTMIEHLAVEHVALLEEFGKR